MPETQKPTVPKFASFRPKSTPQANNAASPASKGKDTEDGRSNTSHRKDAHKGRHQDRKQRDRSKRRHDEQESNRDVIKASPSVVPGHLDVDDTDLYRVDRKGDIANLAYKTMHRYSVPTYWRFGHGSVIGANPKQRIDRNLSDEKGIVIDEQRKATEPGSRRLLQRMSSKRTPRARLVRASSEDQYLDPHEDFIMLAPDKKRKRGSQSPISEHGDVNYRSVEGRAKASNEPADLDLEFASDSSSANSDFDETNSLARKRNAELTRCTRDEPQNLSAWLELIDHQAALIGFKSSGILSNTEQRNLADIRLSIYEQALKVVTEDSKSITTLQLGLLAEGSKIWEAKKIAQKWANTLQDNPDNIEIWTAYLSFIQSSFTEFRYERCKLEYVTCLQILAKARSKASTTAKKFEITNISIYVFLRLTVFMRESGYQEHAEALWQAILELYFFRPPNLASEDRITESFEEFWESEVPRIGEPHSKGWINFSAGDCEMRKPVTVEPKTISNRDNVFRNFAESEVIAAKDLSHPGRTDDDAGEDDPYHIILFSDISPILFPVMLHLQPVNDLIPAFLLYLGLPPLPLQRQDTHNRWWSDPFLRTIPIYSNTKVKNLISHYQTTTEALFTDAFEDTEIAEPSWARQVLRSLVDAIPDDDVLAEYFLALEFYFDSSSAAKTAKVLLKRRRSSIRLYNCYGIIDSRTKGISSGDRIFDTAITMTSSLGSSDHRLLVLLWRTWIWEHLRTGDVSQSMQRILSIGESNPSNRPTSGHAIDFPPAVLLRVKRSLTDGRDGMFSTGDYHLSVLYSELLALLAYFQHGQSIEAALNIYRETSAIFVERKAKHSPLHEHLHQAKAQLLSFHVTHTHLYRLAAICESLAESIALFPDNTMFLVGYARNQARFRIDDRLRSPMSEMMQLDRRDSIIGWGFSIWAEMQRGLEFGGTVHAVRAVFERAVERIGKHSIWLWTSYFLFERSRGDFQRAKQVFFRGLTSLPWSKWFIILAFEHLDHDMSFEEMRRIWNVFGEKELRTHVDIGDLLDEIVAEESSSRKISRMANN